MHPVYIAGSVSFIWMLAKGKQLCPVGLKKQQQHRNRALQVLTRLSMGEHAKPCHSLHVARFRGESSLDLLAFYIFLSLSIYCGKILVRND